ncbi:MAG: DM13 domain-containing protein [Rhodospirillaceae bacterium]|nr:DM13 domain-containing protein [Rhodospirillaceae bacterium]MBT5944259.1 DM13 domain-containing protein [Rhodospirillaceae bacterium]MBT6403935.1 DM13 domain-containing protein [Rhodospirillaceae bacterium]MBT6534920.1 DM13 domain-containing protein [Rhodospirillaceae bacterium]MBT7362782.1 DM13 domain-containing protein [Rhodospirillaceae bacterium]
MQRRTFLAVAVGTLLTPFVSVGAAADTKTLGIGTFRDGDPIHRGSGNLRISRDDNDPRRVELLGMQIVPGPNLFVYLVENEDPLFPEDVTAKFLSLGNLKSLTGDQSYDMPADVDLAEWGSVVVWCDTFKTAFAVASIEMPA